MTTTTTDRHDLLTLARIPWRRFVALGGDIAALADEARAHGDEDLRRRALAALRRRA